jgi:GNAT superfamily N-acetyltransferase
MEISIKPVQNKKDLRIFINLPAKIHKDHKNWVPPIYMDDRVFFNPKKNVTFQYCDTILLLAFERKNPVGRIMGIINHKYNDPKGLKEARFCFLETYRQYDVARQLIAAIEEWAKEKGMRSLVGPLGFSDKDPQGLLVEGFDEPVVLATNCNFPYLVDFVEKAGFSKKTDLVVYKLLVPEVIPEFYRRIHERTTRNNGHLKLISFSSRRQMKKYVKPVLTLVNQTFTEIYAFAPLSEKEMNEFANRYIFLLDPEYLKVVENEKGEVIAFVLGMSDISKGIQKCKGRLIPFGIFRLFLAKRKTRQLNLLLGAIKAEYRNAGLDTLMGISMLESARNRGMKFIDSHLELETNTKMRAEMEKMGGVVYKRFRIFEKSLSEPV